MKTIGVIGGVSAQATMDFEARVHTAAQRLIPPDGNRGYPPMVVYYHRRPPVLLREDRTPVTPFQVDPELARAVRSMAGVADFLVIVSNSAHLVRSDIEEAAGRPVLSMIDATLAEVRRRSWRRVGVLGFMNPRVPVYTEAMREMGLAHENVDAAMQERLDAAIHRVAEGREGDADRAVVREAVALLRARGVHGIIPGCTELPLLLGPDADAPDMVNPAALLAEAAVEHALR